MISHLIDFGVGRLRRGGDRMGCRGCGFDRRGIASSSLETDDNLENSSGNGERATVVGAIGVATGLITLAVGGECSSEGVFYTGAVVTALSAIPLAYGVYRSVTSKGIARSNLGGRR